MLTRQGWTVTWAALLLFATGRLLGIGEFYVFGAMASLLVLGTVLYVRLTRLDLEVDRRIQPSRVHAGSTSRVEIHVRNLRRATTPLLRLHDRVSGTDGAQMLLPPLEPRGDATTTYRLPTTRRGVLTVGPLTITVADPFGLAHSALDAAGPVEVTIFPHVDDVLPVPFTVGHDPLAGALQTHSLSPSGDDFYALRPYVMGDDLRRIHWPSTARHDELLVCQHEQPWQGRTTVLLDVHDSGYETASFEVAVSAAASIVSANAKRRDLVRLVTTDGRDSGLGTGFSHLERMLEHLALVQATSRANLPSMVDLLRQGTGSGGAFVVVAGDLTGERTGALARLRSRLGSLSLVQVERSATLESPTPARPAHSWAGRPATGRGLPTIPVTEQTPFPRAWNDALRARHPAPAATGAGSRRARA